MDRQYRYLIVGDGMAAGAAVRGIREVDSDGTVGMVGIDKNPPYQRPWLSKALWKGESIDGVWLEFPGEGVDLHLGHNVEQLDPGKNQIRDDDGHTFTYETLLLATGVRPRHIAPDSAHVIAFRTFDGFRQLWDLAQTKQKFAVIGNGFIGSEIAAALTMNGKEVEMIFPGAAIGDRVYPADLAKFISDRYRSEKIALRSHTKVAKVTDSADHVVLDLTDADGAAAGQIEVDAVVSGIGSDPNDELAKAAGLKVDHGIIVDNLLRTSQPNIYAAGDVAKYFQSSLGQYVRIEHEDNALTMGKAAGRAMAGKGEPYDHLPFFYSDLFDLGYEAVGELDSRHTMVEDWIDPLKSGVVYYLDGQQVRGVLNWNVWDKVPTARKMIGKDLPAKGEGLRAEMLAS